MRAFGGAASTSIRHWRSNVQANPRLVQRLRKQQFDIFVMQPVRFAAVDVTFADRTADSAAVGFSETL